jgi:hypothetical protein
VLCFLFSEWSKQALFSLLIRRQLAYHQAAKLKLILAAADAAPSVSKVSVSPLSVPVYSYSHFHSQKAFIFPSYIVILSFTRRTMAEKMTQKEKQGSHVEMGDTLSELVAGYPRLAGHMERLPCVAFFRGFRALNTRVLLHMQADLVSLERELVHLEKADKDSLDGERQLYSANWLFLKYCTDSNDPAATAQWLKLKEIIPKLKEYSKLSLSYRGQ